MLKLLTCAQGHYWEKPSEDETNGSAEPCPVCGQPAEAMPLLDLAPSEVESTGETPVPPPPHAPLRDKDGRPVVAGYEILQDLGKGPTGIHRYKARQGLVNRIVVLKVVFAKDDPGQFAWGSLRGEASALGRLTHPHIVQLFEAGERERQLFYNSIEFVEGPTLADAQGGEPLPLRRAIALIETLARTVHHAHQKNIVHRNLKPASILLASSGTDANPLVNGIPKIAGFGLARRPVEGDVIDAELQGELPCYLAPEQAWGRAKEIGPATDVYALGAILYELIAGRQPFREATTTETLDAIQCREPPPLSRLRSRVPSDLDAICRKCLAKPPRRRYASALDLAEDLRRCAAGLPVKARVASNPERLGKWLRRNFRGVAFVMLGLCLGAALMGLIEANRDNFLSLPYREQRDRHTITRLESELLDVRRQKNKGDYLRYLLLTQRAVEDGDKTSGPELLERCPKEMRGWEWNYLHGCLRDADRGLHNANVWGVLTTDLPIICMDASRGGRYLAVGTGRGNTGEVSVWDIVERQRLWHWRMTEPVRSVAFSPENDCLAMVSAGSQRGRKGTLEARHLQTGLPVFPPQSFTDRTPASVIYSADFRYLLVIAQDGTIHFLRPSTAEKDGTVESLRLDNRPGEYVKSLAIPMPGESCHLVLISPDGREIRMIPDPWNPLASMVFLERDAQIHLALACDPQYKNLAAGGMAKTIALWDMRSPRQPPRTLRGHRGAVTGLAFTGDGKRLASCSADGTVRLWDVEQGLELLTLRGYEDASAVAFRHPKKDEMDVSGLDMLAIAHGNKVTLLAPR